MIKSVWKFINIIAISHKTGMEQAEIIDMFWTYHSLIYGPEVPKDIGEGFAHVMVQSILKEVYNNLFCFLVDESRDVSGKEQMAMALIYIDSSGVFEESFVGLVHVKETTSSYL